MEPAPQSPATVPSPSVESPQGFTPPSSSPSKKLLILFGGVGILIMLLVIFLLHKSSMHQGMTTNSNPTTPTAYPTQNENSAANKPATFVYGSWFVNESRVYVVDPETQISTLLTSMPFTIKKLHLLAQDKIIYINHTNPQDQGTDISLLDTTNQTTSQIVQADTGYLIDDYHISPNGQYLVDWELQLSSQNTVKGGKSRIYTVDLSHPGTKTLLFDESAENAQIHYPMLVTDTKEVYLDTYFPNTGAGHGYDVNISSFDGVRKEAVSQMKNGTYGTLPQLTSDGRYLVFTGYDGSKGKGTDIDTGVRIAARNPTSIDVYDLTTKKRQTLPNLPPHRLFYNVTPSTNNPDLIFFQVAASTNTLDTSVYRYSIKHQTAERLAYPPALTARPILVTALSPTILILGSMTQDTTIVGNLGMNYAAPFTTLTQWNTATNTVTPLSLGDVSLVQYIATLNVMPSKVLAAAVSPSVTPTTSLTPTPTKIPELILNTFPFATVTPPPPPTVASPPPPVTKPVLKVVRQVQQSTPSENEHPRPDDNGARLCDSCEHPLYLYGPIGQHVVVDIETTISRALPASDGEFRVTLAASGKLRINTKLYESISYDFVPRVTPAVPKYGSIVSRDTLEQTISWYAEGLGLNKKETADLLTYGKEKLLAPYTFVSFFDEKTSERILPVTFSPRPDYYQNILFYFKDLQTQSDITLPLPQFPHHLKRFGFTAIDIGEIHE